MTAVCAFGLSTVIALATPDGADVTIRNRLTNDAGTCTLDVDGLQIGVVWDSGPGNVPDDVTITAPPGYRVDAPVSVVPEGADVVVHVTAIGMM